MAFGGKPDYKGGSSALMNLLLGGKFDLDELMGVIKRMSKVDKQEVLAAVDEIKNSTKGDLSTIGRIGDKVAGDLNAVLPFSSEQAPDLTGSSDPMPSMGEAGGDLGPSTLENLYGAGDGSNEGQEPGMMRGAPGMGSGMGEAPSGDDPMGIQGLHASEGILAEDEQQRGLQQSQVFDSTLDNEIAIENKRNQTWQKVETYLDDILAKQQAVIESIDTSPDFDTKRWWKNKSTGSKVLFGISMGLQSMSSAASAMGGQGSPQAAFINSMSMINNAISMDVNEQVMEYEQGVRGKMAKATGYGQLYGQFRDRGLAANEAAEAAKGASWSIAEKMIARLSITTPEAQAAASKMREVFSAKKMQAEQKFAEKGSYNALRQLETFRYLEGGKGAPTGGDMAKLFPPAGTGQGKGADVAETQGGRKLEDKERVLIGQYRRMENMFDKLNGLIERKASGGKITSEEAKLIHGEIEALRVDGAEAHGIGGTDKDKGSKDSWKKGYIRSPENRIGLRPKGMAFNDMDYLVKLRNSVAAGREMTRSTLEGRGVQVPPRYGGAGSQDPTARRRSAQPLPPGVTLEPEN